MHKFESSGSFRHKRLVENKAQYFSSFLCSEQRLHSSQGLAPSLISVPTYLSLEPKNLHQKDTVNPALRVDETHSEYALGAIFQLRVSITRLSFGFVFLFSFMYIDNRTKMQRVAQ